jgi:hypothetical protein
MADTNGRLAIVTDARRAGVMRPTKQPVNGTRPPATRSAYRVNVRSAASRGSRFSIIAARAD